MTIKILRIRLTTNQICTDTSGVGKWNSLMSDDLVFFGGESEDSLEDLPWGKDWIKMTAHPEQPIEVFTCILGDKGIYMETGSYKTFIFKKERVHKDLREALLVWTSEGLPVKPLISAYMGKKFHYGINQSKPDVVWVRDENRFTSKRTADDDLPRTDKTRNPFLPSNNPTEQVATVETTKPKRSPK